MKYAIIVAGGKGLRMGTDIPKQFLPVGDKVVLMHTLTRFHEYDPKMQLILVLPREQQDYWQGLCNEYHFGIPHTIADGGSTRWESSKNGLSMIPDDAEGVVGIHDGVRPFVSVEVIGRCYEVASLEKAVIPVLPVTDTLRIITADGGYNVLRSDYRSVQTPQVFDIQLLKQAFREPYSESFTDDASVVEAIGQKVSMTDGNRENIKITTPFDLKVAELLIQTK